MLHSSSTDSIEDWLQRSKSTRQSRVDKLNEFEIFVESKSSTPTQMKSPFLKKYQNAQSQLERLQQQLDDMRIASPPRVNTNDESSSNVNHHKDTKNMNKSHSESTFKTGHKTHHQSLKPYEHSRSQECLSSHIDGSDDSTNPYSLNDIHPSLLGNLSTKKHHLSTKSSSSISIRSQLLSANESKVRRRNETQIKDIRRSLMELESTSDLHSLSSVKSKRKSPRKRPSLFEDQSPCLSPSKSLFNPSCISPKRKPNRTLSVSFVDANNPIDRVRDSILFEHSDETALASPRSPSFMMRSPKSTKSLLAAIVEQDHDDEALRSPNTCASSVLSRKSTVYDLMDESERRIEDKQSNIDIYRSSVLHQLNHARSKRQIALEHKQNEHKATLHFETNLLQQMMLRWMAYKDNEIAAGYEYRQTKVESLCLNQWKRMCSILNMIRQKRYLKRWRQSNAHQKHKIHKLLDFPTRSRRTFLKLISVLRLSRNSFDRKRYKVIVRRMFARYGLIVVFVLFCSWRSIAQQKNIAAFNIVQMIAKHDTNVKMNALRLWRANSKGNRLKRRTAFEAAVESRRVNICKIYFKNWMQLFIYEATVKIALFHWCQHIEHRVFHKWMDYTQWSIASKAIADKCCAKNVLKRSFTFWIDEFLRIQNERAWKKWREQTQKQQLKPPQPVANSYFSEVRSVSMDLPQNLFFPYYRNASSDNSQTQITNQLGDDDQVSYIKHCQLQSILIPTYDTTMAAKYN